MARSHFPTWLVAVLLVLVTIAIYWPAMQCDFINLDDPAYVTANPHVQGGLSWEGVKWAFSNTEQAAYWAPLMWLSHELACQLFGLNPWGHHLMNVLLHAANTALVFLVFRRITGATWRSLMLAALFGLHPLRVESVAWVTERKDVLSTLFWMLTLLAYAKYVEVNQVRDSKSKVWYGAALVMFVSGLMSKAMLVTLPCVLLLLDYWPLERFKSSSVWRLVKEKIPFFVLAATACVVTFVVQKQGGAVKALEVLPLGERVGNALISYCRYLGKIFWPTDLAVFYPHPGHWPLGMVLLAGVFLCSISLLLFVKRGRCPYLLIGWLWFVGTLVPVIQFVQSGEQAMADRFTYVPSIGVLILIIWGIHELTGGWRYQRIVLMATGSVAIAFCIGLTRQQLGYWKDDETLFQHTLKITQNNYIAHYDLGNIFLNKGQINDAINQFQEAIRLKPDYVEARCNLGGVLFKQGQTDEAISQYQEVIRLKSDDVETRYNLGVALFKKGQINEAISQYQEAIRLKPDDAKIHDSFGIALFQQGQTGEGINQFQEAIRLKPNDAEARYCLGLALFNLGQIDEAISQYHEAIRLKPDYIEARYNLGIAFRNKGQIDEEIGQFQEVILLKPDFAEARNNLGAALLNKDQIDEAIRQFQEAIRLKPDDVNAQNNLAKALKLKNKSNAPTSGSVKP